MSVSIGATGAHMGPRGAIESFGEAVEGRAFDRRVVVRLLAYLRPHDKRMAAAFALFNSWTAAAGVPSGPRAIGQQARLPDGTWIFVRGGSGPGLVLKQANAHCVFGAGAGRAPGPGDVVANSL